MKTVIGLDFGSDSVRAVLCETASGKLLAQAVSNYPRWKKGMYCDAPASQFRQHPKDYMECMETVVTKVLADGPAGSAASVAGIAVDTTGSTPIFADGDGTPLALKPGFEEDPDAMFILWKDHTSVDEAAEINSAAAKWKGQNPLSFVGGIYSSEWFWAKALHILRKNKKVADASATLIEHCDWIPALLTDTKGIEGIKRSRCAAGHKALWSADFNGYPESSFFTDLDPQLSELWKSLGSETYTSKESAGTLCVQWAERLGLSTDVVVAVGAFDAHMGAVGADVRSHQLAKVMGTSTCDILVAPPEEGGNTLVQGICGQVDGSVIPGLTGFEAGQSAFGDVYAWFRKLISWPVELMISRSGELQTSGAVSGLDEAALRGWLEDNIIPALEAEAMKIDPEESAVLALDWLNGRRTPDADQNLRGAIAGLQLGTDAPRIYRALVEATAYGSRAIVERFVEQGVEIESVIALGGVSQKAKMVMQIVSDVLNMEISVSAAEQACALGAAMFASVAAGVYTDVEDAQNNMSAGFSEVYKPNPHMVEKYNRLYKKYIELGKCEESLAKGR